MFISGQLRFRQLQRAKKSQGKVRLYLRYLFYSHSERLADGESAAPTTRARTIMAPMILERELQLETKCALY